MLMLSMKIHLEPEAEISCLIAIDNVVPNTPKIRAKYKYPKPKDL